MGFIFCNQMEKFNEELCRFEFYIFGFLNFQLGDLYVLINLFNLAIKLVKVL